MEKFYLKQLLAAALMLCSIVATAHDFEVDGIYYNITDATAKTVEVTRAYEARQFYRIPPTITDNNVVYSVTSIGIAAFKNCTDLYSVTIGNSVTNIRNHAFDNCNSLIEVFTSDLTAWCKIDFADYTSNPLYYAHNLYLNYEKVTNLVIPDGVTEIKYHAFSDYTGLTSVTIPNSVTSIGIAAFDNCTELKSVTIGNSITSILFWAFDGCTNLKEIYSLSETPADIESETFDSYSATLYVPVGAKEAYQSAEYWGDFTNIVEMDFTDIDDIEADASFKGVRGVYYDLKGRVVDNPTKGTYIIDGKKVQF